MRTSLVVTTDYQALPPELPVPEDDGAADHLPGVALPPLRLPVAGGGEVDLAEAAVGLLVVFVYPRTGTPGQPSPAGWDEIPGARGCTPQSCGFRDRFDEISGLGAGVIGISAMSQDEQAEFAQREHLPYRLLNDRGLRLRDELGLPTFEAAGMTLYERLTFVAWHGRIVKVFYPVFPPRSRTGCMRAALTAALADVDGPDGVLVGQLVEHLADDVVDIALVVAEVVQQGLQGGPGDLELGRSEIEPVSDLVRSDQVEVLVRHRGRKTTLRACPRRGYLRARRRTSAPLGSMDSR
jgi:peroxiredoxin